MVLPLHSYLGENDSSHSLYIMPSCYLVYLSPCQRRRSLWLSSHRCVFAPAADDRHQRAGHSTKDAPPLPLDDVRVDGYISVSRSQLIKILVFLIPCGKTNVILTRSAAPTASAHLSRCKPTRGYQVRHPTINGQRGKDWSFIIPFLTPLYITAGFPSLKKPPDPQPSHLNSFAA